MPASTVIVLSCDVMAIIAMIILLYALLFENSEKDKKTKYFALCSFCTLLSLAMDIPAWLFENRVGYDALLYVVNVLALVFSLGTVAFISFYEIEIIGRKEHISDIHAKIIVGVCAGAAIAISLGSITGKTFSVENGVFTYGPWYPIAAIVSLVMLVYMEIIAFVKSKYLGLHDTLAFASYMVLPFISVVIEILHPEVSLALAATALSSLLLYVMLQSGHVSALHMRGELLNELSYTDMMTGLQNRRCYDETLTRLAEEPVLNVIFCDVNGLKFTNDTLGHAAGDERLKSFAELLKRHFSYDSIFRISGDEFVVIIPKLTRLSFEERLRKLKADIEEQNGLASVGASSGSGAKRMDILKEAETRMYEDKKLNYQRHPEYIR